MKPRSLRNWTLVVAPYAALIACAALAIVDGVLSAITPGYDTVQETSSQLMNEEARYSAIARITLGLYAVLIVPFAVQLSLQFSKYDGARSRVAGLLAIGGIWIHVVSGIVAALALNDSDSGVIGNVTANNVHDMSARVMFGAGIAMLVGASVHYWPRRSLFSRYTVTTAVLAAATSIVFAMETATGINGVLERVIGWLFLSWISVVAVAWRRSRPELPADVTPP